MATNVFRSDSQHGIIGSIKLIMFVGSVFGAPFRLKDSNLIVRILYYSFSTVITGIFIFAYTYYEITDLLNNRDNLYKFTQNACLSFTHIGGVFKCINLIYFSADLNETIQNLTEVSIKFIETKKQKETFLQSERMNKIVFLVYFSTVGITALFGMILVSFKPDMVGQSFPYSAKTPDFLPLEWQAAYCSLSAMIIALQIVSIDYLNINFINQISCQLRALNHRLEDLWEESTIADKVIPVAILDKCIQHHQQIIILRNRIEKAFQLPVLIQFIISIIIFALTGFQAMVNNGTVSSVMILLYFYCGCIFLELLIYCWFANEVIEQSKSLPTVGYSTRWYDFNQLYRKKLIIFIINAQRPIFFTSGGFFKLSLDTFSSILTRSYSYIALLKQIYGN